VEKTVTKTLRSMVSFPSRRLTDGRSCGRR
jgi:hypothetical protein